MPTPNEEIQKAHEERKANIRRNFMDKPNRDNLNKVKEGDDAINEQKTKRQGGIA